MNAARARDVHTTANQLESAATGWGFVTALAALLAAWGLRHLGVATWAPVLAVGIATAWFGFAAASLAVHLARLRASAEE